MLKTWELLENEDFACEQFLNLATGETHWMLAAVAGAAIEWLNKNVV